VSLVKSPVLTAAKLAANRANARKSTGPRSDMGRSRVALNALRHGRWASRKLFRLHLLLAGEDLALYNWIYEEVCVALKPATEAEWRRMDRLARQVWCFLVLRPMGWPDGWPKFRPGAWPAQGPARRRPTRSSVWCLLSSPERQKSWRRPRYAVRACPGRVMGESSYWLQLSRNTYLKFWVRRRRRAPEPRPESSASARRGAKKPASGRFRQLCGTLWNKATMFFRMKRCETYAPPSTRLAAGEAGSGAIRTAGIGAGPAQTSGSVTFA